MIDTSKWNVDTIYKIVFEKQMNNISRHKELKNAFDFLGLHGYKRWQEHRYFCELYKHDKLERYFINEHHKLLDLDEINTKSLIDKFYHTNDDSISIGTKKQFVEIAFNDWVAWEKETRELYAYCVEWLLTNKCADSRIFMKFLEDVDEEIKYAERHVLKLKNIAYNFDYIVCWQDAIHEKYKEKTEDIKIEFC